MKRIYGLQIRRRIGLVRRLIENLDSWNANGIREKHPQNLAIRMVIQLDPHSLFSNLDSSSPHFESLTQCYVRIAFCRFLFLEFSTAG